MRIQVLILLLLSITPHYAQTYKEQVLNKDYTLTTSVYRDDVRHRDIPVAIYTPTNKKLANNIPVIFNHGWGGNVGGDYLIYSYLNSFLAAKGYFVISIQHELPSDPLLALEGELKVVRMPNWVQGIKNIEVVIDHLKKDYPTLKYNQLALIGHSNGGDMANLYTRDHDGTVHTLITLDNRRMDLPRTSHTRVFSLRGSDYPADKGVLPTTEEAEKYKITVQPTTIPHGHMDNKANAEEKAYLCAKVLEYLKP
ncbi:MAG: alpha/beta hydrolase [Flavobacterium sp.]